MTTRFTKNDFMANRGCYSRKQAELLLQNNKHETIFDFLDWEIPIKDKVWFINKACDLSLKEKQALALVCAKVSLKIYELKYPGDKRISNCIDAIVDFNEGKITKDELLSFRRDAAYAAAAAAYAADAADAYAADAAAAYAAAAAAYAYAAAADAYAADAAYAAAYAADAAYAATKSDNIHTTNLLNALKQFFTDNATI